MKKGKANLKGLKVNMTCKYIERTNYDPSKDLLVRDNTYSHDQDHS